MNEEEFHVSDEQQSGLMESRVNTCTSPFHLTTEEQD